MIIKFGKWMSESGGTKAWFHWIEWVTLASGFIAVGWKAKLYPVIAIGVFSTFLLWFYAIHGLSNTIGRYFGSLNWPKWIVWPLIIVISYTLPIVTIVVVVMAIMAFIKA